MTEVTITKYYEEDHDRLDGLFQDYQRLKSTDKSRATECFMEFASGLRRHILWEEEILFPLFEQKTGMTQHGPTVVMRMEHKEIQATLEAMQAKILSGDFQTTREETQLLSVLGLHNSKEEGILYPMIDQHSTEEDRVDIFRKMEAVPESRYRPAPLQAGNRT